MRYVRETALQLLGTNTIREARAEEVPSLLETTQAIGITGEDILENYRAGGGRQYRVMSLDCAWKGPYAKSVFGLPALCVLGRNGIPPQRYAQYFGVDSGKYCSYLSYLLGKKVVIPQRYEQLIRKRTTGISIDFLVIKRKVDVTLAMNNSIDFAIDIVLTGKTCEELGLGICDVLFKSDGAIIWGGKK